MNKKRKPSKLELENALRKKMYDEAGLNSYQISKKILDVFFQKETIRVVKN